MAINIVHIDSSFGDSPSTLYTCPTGKRARVRVLRFTPDDISASGAVLAVNQSAVSGTIISDYDPLKDGNGLLSVFTSNGSSLAHSSFTRYIINGCYISAMQGGSSPVISVSNVPYIYLEAGDYLSAVGDRTVNKVCLNIVEETV